MSARDGVAASTAEARAVRGCQILQQQLDAATAKLHRLREDYTRLHKWALENADNNFAGQVAYYAAARLSEWNEPIERWEP